VAVEMLGVRDIDINQLTFFPGNARRGQLDQIRQSVRRLGQYRSVVVRVVNEPPAFVVLAGNHTVQAMRAEGHQTAHCGLIRCTDDEARRVNLGDNKLSDIATDDLDSLAELLSYLDGDYDGTGWSVYDVDKLVDHMAPPTNPSDEWVGMPDFNQPGQQGAYSTMIHFPTGEDADKFFALIDRPRARSLWWPHDDGHHDSELGKMEVAE
jgi:hypothetical protein